MESFRPVSLSRTWLSRVGDDPLDIPEPQDLGLIAMGDYPSWKGQRTSPCSLTAACFSSAQLSLAAWTSWEGKELDLGVVAGEESFSGASKLESNTLKEIPLSLPLPFLESLFSFSLSPLFFPPIFYIQAWLSEACTVLIGG